MPVLRLIIFALLSSLLPANAQDVRWELKDTGVLNHSKHGKGIEMRIKPDPLPNGLFGNKNLDKLLLSLCKHYAPSVIPFVKQKTNIGTPDFIAVRIISGGQTGRYVLQAYTISDNQCSDEL